MKSIIFVTGNDEKIRDARFALGEFNITLTNTSLEIDEIQHHDPTYIATAKAVAAFDQIKKPLVINDSSWSIPALGGFPGGYMKDITAWLSTDDFLVLMKEKKDRRILLHEVVVYIDQAGHHIFEAIREGQFTDTPAGNSSPSFARIVKMEGDSITISQIFDKEGERDLDPKRYVHWNSFADWYIKQK